MRTSEYQHFIFVRPPGSLTWTLHMTPKGTPWRDGRAKQANSEACKIVEHTKNSAIVVPVMLPRDAEKRQYALFADGDTEYLPVEPVLRSKKTGKAK